MKKMIFLFVIFIQTQGFALQEPQLTKTKKTFSYSLGSDIEKELSKYNSFQIFTKERFPKEIHKIFLQKKHQAPMLSLLDINNDKKMDAVVMGFVEVDKKPFIEVVALISNNKKYEIKPIKRWKLPNLGMQKKDGKFVGQWPYYVLQATDKEHQFNGIPESASAFKVEAYQSSSILYFWNGKKFKFIKH